MLASYLSSPLIYNIKTSIYTIRMESNKKIIFFSIILSIFANNLFTQQKKIDIDFTKLNPIMAYSELYNILFNPERYIGKTFKLKGLVVTTQIPNTNITIYSCAISDSTGCCVQGLSFKLNSLYKFPTDYPKENSTITVTGTFDKTHTKDFDYYLLKNSYLE